jgi:transglutaminase-like putative cysteine protease
MQSTNFLSPGRFIDSGSPDVIAFARSAAAGAGSELGGVLRLYQAVRDGIVYDPYVDMADPANYRASQSEAVAADEVGTDG